MNVYAHASRVRFGEVAFILLAAGGSSRMGCAKQFLNYQGQTLLRRSAEAALASGCRPVVVVLGAHAERARDELAGLQVLTVDNADWGQGIGSSIRAGMAALAGHEVVTGQPIDAVVFGLCDQPLVGPAAFARLLDAYSAGGKGIVAASYGGTTGVPAVFGRRYFDELRALPAAAGAKALIGRHGDDVAAVPVPEAGRDVDTPEDYQGLAAAAGDPAATPAPDQRPPR
jgi:molybdenum cofactor cytidylyltransferase